MKEELSKFGLNSTDQDILLFLLKFGARAAGVISKRLEFKRSTVYSSLENLVKLNLVKKYMENGQFVFHAESAEKIPDILIRNEEARYSKVLNSVEQIKGPLKEYVKNSSATLGRFDFELIESSERYAEYMILNNSTRNYYSVWDPAVSIYNNKTKKEMEVFFTKSAKNKNKIKEILVKGPVTDWYVSKIKNPNHKVKTIVAKLFTAADITLYEQNDTLISLMTPESESALLLKNGDMFNFFKNMFDHMWNTTDN